MVPRGQILTKYGALYGLSYITQKRSWVSACAFGPERWVLQVQILSKQSSDATNIQFNADQFKKVISNNVNLTFQVCVDVTF